jgi:protein-L-isoaspartate(D-aspartate) O-methyltransferase
MTSKNHHQRNLMKPMDFEQARHNMIEQQVRPWDVLDQRVLDVMTTLPREAFVPEQYRALAFADISIPLGQDQVMMSPKLEGRLLQTLDIKPDDTVLEIGTGSGYLTACLASLGQHVTSWEIFPELSAAAKARLAGQDIGNVTLEVGDATREIADEVRYDVIAVTGSVPVRDHRQAADHGGPADNQPRRGQLGPGKPVRDLAAPAGECHRAPAFRPLNKRLSTDHA